MPGNVRRLSAASLRPNRSAGIDSERAISEPLELSDTASGLSDNGAIDPDYASADGDAAIDPDAPYGRKADGTARKRRARQPGASGSSSSGERKTGAKKKGALGIEGLASIICNATLMLAAASKTPEAMLNNDEASLIASAAENVAQYYDFSVDSKAVAWANLALTVGGIVGSHVVAYKLRREAERARG